MAKNLEIEEMVKALWATCNEDSKRLIEEFLDNSTELSKDTLVQYTSALKIFACYLNKFCKNKHLTEVKSMDFKKYLNWLYNMGLHESAIKMKRSAISSLNNYIILYYGESDYLTFRNYITPALKTPQTGKVHEKLPLSDAEYEKLCQELILKEDWQKLAYLKFTYISGCRRNESRQLLKEVVDYKPTERMVKVKDENGIEHTLPVKKYKTHLIKCKGKKNDPLRKLSFDEDTLFYFNKWLEVRGEDDCPYMFISGKQDTARMVSQNGFNQWCKCFEKIIGRRIHPHMLRMSRATNLYLSGKNIEAIKTLLGHKSSDTTRIYIIRDEDDDEDEIFV